MQAHQQWQAIGLEGAEDELIPLYLAQVQDKKNARSCGDFSPMFPHVCRWLKYHRWEDEVGEDTPQASPMDASEALRAFECLKGGK